MSQENHSIPDSVFHQYVLQRGSQWRDVLIRFLAAEIHAVLDHEFAHVKKTLDNLGNRYNRNALLGQFQRACILIKEWPRNRAKRFVHDVNHHFLEKFHQQLKSRLWTVIWCDVAISNFTRIRSKKSFEVDDINMDDFVLNCCVSAAMGVGCKYPQLFDPTSLDRFEFHLEAAKLIQYAVSDYIVSIIPSDLLSSNKEDVERALQVKTPLIGLRVVRVQNSSSQQRARGEQHPHPHHHHHHHRHHNRDRQKPGAEPATPAKAAEDRSKINDVRAQNTSAHSKEHTNHLHFDDMTPRTLDRSIHPADSASQVGTSRNPSSASLVSSPARASPQKLEPLKRSISSSTHLIAPNQSMVSAHDSAPDVRNKNEITFEDIVSRLSSAVNHETSGAHVSTSPQRASNNVESNADRAFTTDEHSASDDDLRDSESDDEPVDEGDTDDPESIEDEEHQKFLDILDA